MSTVNIYWYCGGVFVGMMIGVINDALARRRDARDTKSGAGVSGIGPQGTKTPLAYPPAPESFTDSERDK